MFKVSSKYLDVVLKASILSACLFGKRHHKVSLKTKLESIGNHGSTISAHRNPNYLSIQLGANSNKNVVQQKGQCITYILTRPCMIFLGSEYTETKF